MNTLFDDHVARALAGAESVDRNLLPVIEKEILHHDIIRELHESGLLARLVFFGGTSLRLCYGSQRLSEDLDFKGGHAFHLSDMERLDPVLVAGLSRKYGLVVDVEEPKIKDGDTKTWTIRVTTHPGSKSEKQQRINIDICSLEAFERVPRLLANYYSVDLGTTGLIIGSQSLKESYTDKLIAVAFRKRLQSRDLWDLMWLKQRLADITPFHLYEKILELEQTEADFLARFDAILRNMRRDPIVRSAFVDELARFLPARFHETATNPEFWDYTVQALGEDFERCERVLSKPHDGSEWKL
ncbi:MAG: nucleotidyl transferase AbiEii/AbiGii toxin family protein [Rectinemataceae bacterium]